MMHDLPLVIRRMVPLCCSHCFTLLPPLPPPLLPSCGNAAEFWSDNVDTDNGRRLASASAGAAARGHRVD